MGRVPEGFSGQGRSRFSGQGHHVRGGQRHLPDHCHGFHIRDNTRILAVGRDDFMQRKAIVKVDNLVGGYGEEVILDRITFNVYEGEIFVILGGSGCGKSTLMKHIIGLIRPFSGRVIIDGDDVFDPDDAVYQRILRKIGVLYQSSALLGSITLAENVALPIREYTDLPEESVDRIVRMKLKLVNLDGYENNLPSELSGGMRKTGGAGRGLALNPKIIFFDAPSAGLHPVT